MVWTSQSPALRAFTALAAGFAGVAVSAFDNSRFDNVRLCHTRSCLAIRLGETYANVDRVCAPQVAM